MRYSASATSAIIFGYRRSTDSDAAFFKDVEVFVVDPFSHYQGSENASVPQSIPTYDGNNQPKHPSVIKFASWNGFTYWMAMAPYIRSTVVIMKIHLSWLLIVV